MATYPDGFRRVKASKTKPSEKSNTVWAHTWTFDFTGCSLEDVADLAVRGEIIRMQGLIRADAKNGKHPRYAPGAHAIKVSDVIAGNRLAAGPPTLESVLATAKSDPEFAKKLVEMLTAAAAPDPSERE